MDRRSNTACPLSQRGRAKPVPPAQKSRDPSAAPGDRVCLEEVVSPFQNQYPPSRLSCPSGPSSSSSPGCSSEGTGSLYSVSSGVTAPPHSSVKKRSQTAFRARLGEVGRWGGLKGCPFRAPHWRANPLGEQDRGSERTKPRASPERAGPRQGRGSSRTHSGAKSVRLQRALGEKIEGKVKFSQFLNEVTFNILDPNSLRAFGKRASPSGFPAISPPRPEDPIQAAAQRGPWPPSTMARRQGPLPRRWAGPEDQTLPDAAEMDVGPVDLGARAGSRLKLGTDEKNVIPPPPEFCEGFEMTSPVPEFLPDFPPYPYGSVSLPKGINMVSEESPPSFESKQGHMLRLESQHLKGTPE
ncbi:begain [Pungitius sinensis]